MVRKAKATKIIAAVTDALVSVGLVAKAIWDAFH